MNNETLQKPLSERLSKLTPDYTYKFEYYLCKDIDMKLFKEVCAKISSIEGIVVETNLVDVDGSLIQIFTLKEALIIAYCDIDLGVHINSDVELDFIVVVENAPDFLL